jgi:integrase
MAALFVLKWAEPESNRRHKDFQALCSLALNILFCAYLLFTATRYNERYNEKEWLMKTYQATQDWMPPVSKVPIRVQRALLPFTPTVKGWTIWYQGRTRTVCGITVDLAEVPERWAKLKATIDAGVTHAARPTGLRTLREAISDYFQWLDHRVQTGMPKPLAAISAEDYKRNLTTFARFEGEGGKFADIPLAEFGPEHFRAYAEQLTGRSPTSFARIVATMGAFFTYCKDEGILAAEPNYGRYFVRPPQTQVRDRRLQQQKSFEQEELWALLLHADTQELAWMGLALSGAMDNADIAHLTFELFDKEGMLLDYRRRKTGLIPRLIPLHPMAREWLDNYLAIRPAPADPAYKDLVFLTPTGLPLQRSKTGKSGIGSHIDYMAHCWDHLLRKAGLRQKPSVLRVCAVCGKPRSAPRATCCEQRKWKKQMTMAGTGGPTFKGFRSLRTTFANLTPRGFSEERKLIMGHSGDITLDHYVEKFGIDHLQKLVDEVWLAAFTAPWPRGDGIHRAEKRTE